MSTKQLQKKWKNEMTLEEKISMIRGYIFAKGGNKHHISKSSWLYRSLGRYREKILGLDIRCYRKKRKFFRCI